MIQIIDRLKDKVRNKHQLSQQNLFNMVGCRSFDTNLCSDYGCIFRTLSFDLYIDRFTISDCVEGIRLE